MNLYKILPALLILSLLAACSSDKENDVYTTLPFSLSIYQVAMTIEGGEQEVNVSSGGAWQSSIHCDWMTLSPSSGGIGITKVRIKVKENTSGLPRNGRIAIISGKEEKGITVMQSSIEGEEDYLRLLNLTIDGVTTAVDYVNNSYYLPIDMDAVQPAKVKVEFGGIGVDFIKIGDKKIKSGENIALSLNPGQNIEMEAGNNTIDKVRSCRLIVTGVPVIEISAPEGIEDENKRPCDIVLTDPKRRTNSSVLRFESYAGIEFRGAGALRYAKKAFSFKLKNRQTNENQDAKLLGMREDQSWILDAMWLDCGKMRNRVCFDLWNDFNTLYYSNAEPEAVNATHGYPVEMILDGTYHGLYILSDRIDRKQLKLKKKGGYLYKGKEWTDECKLQGINTPYSNSKQTWQGFESDYPDEVGEIEFKYLSDLIQFFAVASKEEFAAQYEERLDISSLIDYFIFINLLSAYDNTGRNVFWGIYNINLTLLPKFIIQPWDLDGTLGRTWDAIKLDPEKGLGFDNGLILRNDAGSKYFRPFERIMNENPNNIKRRIYERLMAVKDNALSPANMASKVDYYKRQIVESGALERDRQRWTGYSMYGYANPEEEAAYMKSWYTARLKYLETIFKDF